jgi:hypothetical protein
MTLACIQFPYAVLAMTFVFVAGNFLGRRERGGC